MPAIRHFVILFCLNSQRTRLLKGDEVILTTSNTEGVEGSLSSKTILITQIFERLHGTCFASSSPDSRIWFHICYMCERSGWPRLLWANTSFDCLVYSKFAYSSTLASHLSSQHPPVNCQNACHSPFRNLIETKDPPQPRLLVDKFLKIVFLCATSLNPMLLIDIPSFPIAIALNPPSLDNTIYMISCVVLGIVGCLGSLLFFYLSRASGTDDQQTLLSKCLLCTHKALNCIVFIYFYIARDLQLTLGKEGCIADYVGVVMVCLVSLGIECLMAFERWLVFCFRRSLTRMEVWQLVLSIWVFSIIVTLIPFFTSTYLEGIQLVEAASYPP